MSDKGELEKRIADLETMVRALREAVAGPLCQQYTWFIRHGWPPQEIEAFEQFMVNLSRFDGATVAEIQADFRKALPYRTDAELTEIFQQRYRSGLMGKGSLVHRYLREMRRTE